MSDLKRLAEAEAEALDRLNAAYLKLEKEGVEGLERLNQLQPCYEEYRQKRFERMAAGLEASDMAQPSALYRTRKVLARVLRFVGKEIIVWGGALGTIVFIVAMFQVTDLRWWQIALTVPLFWIGI